MRRLLRSIIGVPAFFFLSFILMLLWNSLVAGHLGWAPRLSYLQTAGLWLLVSLALAWAAIGARSGRRSHRRPREASWGDRMEQTVEFRTSGCESDDERHDIGNRIERQIRSGLARWVDAGDGTDWSELGELIERKIRRKIADWVD